MKLPSFAERVMHGLSNLASGGDGQLIPQARLSGPMPWVIAIMVALTVIAAAGGLTLRNAASAARAELSGGITVQIVEARPEERTRQAEAALIRLREMPDVISPHIVPAKELDALIEPWLGTDAGDSSAIPVPALIDARLAGEAGAERLQTLGKQLREVAPAARVNAQAGWLGPVFDAIHSLQLLALALVVLLALAMAAAVLLAARNALGANRDTIEIVHFLGGTDTQIARIFQRSMGMDAASGGISGLVFAAAIIWAVGQRFAALGAGLVEGGALGWADWVVLALVPFAAMALAMITARLSVMHALRKML